MARRVLDHNVVLGIWHGRGPSRKPVRSEETARLAARGWLREHPEDGLVTPVRLEFIAGTKDREEQRLGDLFLGEFPLFDDGRILPEGVTPDVVVGDLSGRRVRLSDYKDGERLRRVLWIE